MGPRFFKVRPQAGRPLAIPGLAQGLAWLEEAWRRLEIHGGHVEWHGHQPIIVVDQLQELEDSSPANAEWGQSDIGNSIRVTGGPVMFSSTRMDDSSAYYDVSYSGLSTNDERWLFVEIDLKNQTTTPQFAADADVPVDDPDNYIVRWRLSQWKKTATGIRRLATAWHGGCIHFPAILGPPM